MASTLQRLVPRVVGQVVVFVLLEQVAGVHLVAVLHQTLPGNEVQSVYDERPGNVTQHLQSLVKWAHLLSDQQGRALQRDGHHFVWVPCY